MRQRFDGSVRAMRDRERIVDIEIAELCELRGEFRVVLFFTLVEAGVFQTENLARL